MVTNTAATRVTGALKKKIIRDIGLSFGIGVPLAYTWWYSFHVKRAEARDVWYANYAKKRQEDDE